MKCNARGARAPRKSLVNYGGKIFLLFYSFLVLPLIPGSRYAPDEVCNISVILYILSRHHYNTRITEKYQTILKKRLVITLDTLIYN